MAKQQHALAHAIEPTVAGLGLDLYDVELIGAGRRGRIVRVSVDRDGGVDLDAIAAVSEAISPILDARKDLPAPYTLEVSSPGIERTLRTPSHFRRAIGQNVSVKTGGAEPARRHGALVAADDDGIELLLVDGHERIPYDDIVQARTVFEWGANEKVSS